MQCYAIVLLYVGYALARVPGSGLRGRRTRQRDWARSSRAGHPRHPCCELRQGPRCPHYAALVFPAGLFDLHPKDAQQPALISIAIAWALRLRFIELRCDRARHDRNPVRARALCQPRLLVLLIRVSRVLSLPRCLARPPSENRPRSLQVSAGFAGDWNIIGHGLLDFKGLASPTSSTMVFLFPGAPHLRISGAVPAQVSGQEPSAAGEIL